MSKLPRLLYRATLLSCGVACACVLRATAQVSPELLVTKEVVILRSTRNYQLALQTARQAAGHLRLPLDLEGYRPHPAAGLTMSRANCAASGFGYPAYVARGYGLGADSAFVSIEYSTAYDGFAKGYYLVVTAVGEPGSAAVRRTSTAARRWYADACTRRTTVYIGCLH